MLVNFIGSPCSGKTTTAAMLFASLKEHGTTCEFIGEQARIYIAERKRSLHLALEETLPLFDGDQLAIMRRQLDLDWLLAESVFDDAVVVSDSSPLNALLYMSEGMRENCADYIAAACDIVDLVFYTPPVPMVQSFDANRVHTLEQSREIDRILPDVLKQYAPRVLAKLVRLEGAPQQRLHDAENRVLDRLLRS